MATTGYTVIVDEICQQHGGHGYAYQNNNENFVRWEHVCEGCQSATRKVRTDRTPSPRPARPARS